MRQPRLSHFGRSLLFAGERRDVALNLLCVLERLDEALTERMARVAQLDELLRHLREEGEGEHVLLAAGKPLVLLAVLR